MRQTGTVKFFNQSKGLRLYHAGRRRKGRVRPHHRCRALQCRAADGEHAGVLRDRARQARQGAEGGGPPGCRLKPSKIGPKAAEAAPSPQRHVRAKFDKKCIASARSACARRAIPGGRPGTGSILQGELGDEDLHSCGGGSEHSWLGPARPRMRPASARPDAALAATTIRPNSRPGKPCCRGRTGACGPIGWQRARRSAKRPATR